MALQEKIHSSAFVAAISEFTRSQLYCWCAPEDRRKIAVVRCGVDKPFLAPTDWSVPERPRLVNVGRLCEQKGQLLLIQAAAQLRQRGLDFELVIVGDGPMRGEFQRAIDQFRLGKRVRITGFLDNQNVRREFLASRALVLPSFAEGLPVVIMEALALHRPVISTYIAGIPELVEPGKSGWLVPAGAVNPLVDAMAEALTADAYELEAMGRAGAARVAEKHDASLEARKLADLFTNLDEGIPGTPHQDIPGTPYLISETFRDPLNSS
jgi:glycosyltransferase involved in cell wall biosynthesis